MCEKTLAQLQQVSSFKNEPVNFKQKYLYLKFTSKYNITSNNKRKIDKMRLNAALILSFILVTLIYSVESVCVWQGGSNGKFVCEFHQDPNQQQQQQPASANNNNRYPNQSSSTFSRRKLEFNSDGHDELINQYVTNDAEQHIEVAHVAIPNNGQTHGSDFEEIHSILPNLLDSVKIKKLLAPTRITPSNRHHHGRKQIDIDDDGTTEDHHQANNNINPQNVAEHLESGSLGEYIKSNLPSTSPLDKESINPYSKKKPFRIQILDGKQQATQQDFESTKSTLLVPVRNAYAHGEDQQMSGSDYHPSSISNNFQVQQQPFVPLPEFPTPVDQYAPTQPYSYGKPSPMSAQEQFDAGSADGQALPAQTALFIPNSYAPMQPYSYSPYRNSREYSSPAQEQQHREHLPTYAPTQPYAYGEPSPMSAQQQYEMGSSDGLNLPGPTTAMGLGQHYAPTQPYPTQAYPSYPHNYDIHHQPHQQSYSDIPQPQPVPYPQDPYNNIHPNSYTNQQEHHRGPAGGPMFYSVAGNNVQAPAPATPIPNFQYMPPNPSHYPHPQHHPNYIIPPTNAATAKQPTQLKPVPSANKVKNEKESILNALKTLTQTNPELVKTVAQKHGLGDGVIEFVSKANKTNNNKNQNQNQNVAGPPDSSADELISLPIDQVLTLLLSNQKYSSTGKNYFKNSFTLEENSGTNNNPNELAKILYNMGILQRIAKGTLTFEQMDLVNKLIDLNHQEKLLKDSINPESRKKPAKYIVPRATFTRMGHNNNRYHYDRDRDRSSSDYTYYPEEEEAEARSAGSEEISVVSSNRRRRPSLSTKSYQAYSEKAEVYERYRNSRNRGGQRTGSSGFGRSSREMLLDRPSVTSHSEEQRQRQQAYPKYHNTPSEPPRIHENPVNLNIIIPPSSEQKSRQPVNDATNSGTDPIPNFAPPQQHQQQHQQQQQQQQGPYNSNPLPSPPSNNPIHPTQYEPAQLSPILNPPMPPKQAGLASLLFNRNNNPLFERLRTEWWKGVGTVLSDLNQQHQHQQQHLNQNQPYSNQNHQNQQHQSTYSGGLDQDHGVQDVSNNLQHEESSQNPVQVHSRNTLSTSPVMVQLLSTIGLLSSFMVFAFLGIHLQKGNQNHTPKYRVQLGLRPGFGLTKPILFSSGGQFNQTGGGNPNQGYGPAPGQHGPGPNQPNARPNKKKYESEQENEQEQELNHYRPPYQPHPPPPPQHSAQMQSSAEISIEDVIKEKLLNSHELPSIHLHVSDRHFSSLSSEQDDDTEEEVEEEDDQSSPKRRLKKKQSRPKLKNSRATKSPIPIPFDHSFVSYLHKANSLGLVNNPGLLQRKQMSPRIDNEDPHHQHEQHHYEENNIKPFGSPPVSPVSTAAAIIATKAARQSSNSNSNSNNNNNISIGSGYSSVRSSQNPNPSPTPIPSAATVISTSSTTSTTTMRSTSVSVSTSASTSTSSSTSSTTTEEAPKYIPVEVHYFK